MPRANAFRTCTPTMAASVTGRSSQDRHKNVCLPSLEGLGLAREGPPADPRRDAAQRPDTASSRAARCTATGNERRGEHVGREIVPEEAAIIVRIFSEIAQGRGFAKIAQGLNRDGIAAPRRKWAMTGVREMVFRDLYRGWIVYGKTRWIEKGGTKVKQDRPEAEWLTLEALPCVSCRRSCGRPRTRAWTGPGRPTSGTRAASCLAAPSLGSRRDNSSAAS